MFYFYLSFFFLFLELNDRLVHVSLITDIIKPEQFKYTLILSLLKILFICKMNTYLLSLVPGYNSYKFNSLELVIFFIQPVAAFTFNPGISVPSGGQVEES